MGKRLNARERRKQRRAFAAGACPERRNAKRVIEATPYIRSYASDLPEDADAICLNGPEKGNRYRLAELRPLESKTGAKIRRSREVTTKLFTDETFMQEKAKLTGLEDHNPRNTKSTQWTFCDKRGRLPGERTAKDTANDFKPDEKGFTPFDGDNFVSEESRKVKRLV